MSYEPSHRKPPRQERWPHATPQEGWPAHPRGGADRRVWVTAGYQAQPGYPQAGAADAFAGTGTGYTWPGHGYPGAVNGYPGTTDSFDGYDRSRDDFGGSAGYLDPGEYTRPTSSNPPLIAPDTAGGLGGLRWPPGPTEDSGREAGRYGLIVGAVTGFLAAAVAIGVSTLAAAFVRPQASPIIAVGGAFIDRTPPALKNFAVEHFGENDKTILLLGMYVTVAFIAIAIGCLARHGVTIGVAGIAAFGLFGAFVAITRPESDLTDVIPSVIGGIAGIAAFVWLCRAAAPAAPLRHAHGSSRWKPR